MIKVLSLFDGMSCGQIALNRLGIKPVKYYAAEVDKHAIKVTQANYPNTVQLGDVTAWQQWDIEWSEIDLLIGGSPCQGFSYAGKRLAFEDPRSKLFFIYVDILNHIKSVNPKVKFLLENVKMKKDHIQVIDEYLGVTSVLINSSLVSAQGRKRHYWANWDIEQPKDKGILLEDILEDSSLSVNSEGWHTWWNKNKLHQLKKGYSSIVNDGSRDKAITLTARQYASWNGNFAIVQKPRGNNKGGLRAVNGKSPTLTSNSWEHNNHLTDGEYYRKLSVIECSRLQTVDDDYIKGVSDSQAYKMLGNGWTVDVIAHIFNQAGL